MWRPWSVNEIVVQEVSDEDVNVVESCTEVSQEEENEHPKETRKHLSTDAKELIRTLYSSLKERNVTSPLQETSELLKMSRSTIHKIINNPNEKRKTRNDAGNYKIDCFQEDVIRRKIYDLYQKQIVPTMKLLQKEILADDYDFKCSETSLRKYLTQMGFRYKKIDKKQAIMESSRLQKLRYEYLQQIRKYREENRHVIYLDETWYDTHDTVSKGWVDSSGKCHTNGPSNRGKRITIIHAGSNQGWVPNGLLLSAKNIADSSLDYHQDTTAALFEYWFQHQLLPNIPPTSIIVMDNAPYHSRQLNKVPNCSNTKSEIKNFMIKNDLYYEDNYTKPQLLEVLKTFNFKKDYFCDNLAHKLGHNVLRLPPYYCIFNPIEHIWSCLKHNVRARNKSPTLNESVINLIKEEIEKISINTWGKCVDHIIKIENSYSALIPDISNNLQFTINVDSDSDSEVEICV